MVETAPQRVLLTGDTVGGVWTFTLELAAGLIARGVEVCLATSGRAGSAVQRAEAAKIPGLRWTDSKFKLEWMEEPWAEVEEAGRWLLSVAKQFRPDLVHLNTLCHGALEWEVPMVTTVHSCVASWWAAVKHEKLPSSWDRYRKEVTRSLRSADLVTAPSRAMADSTRYNYGVEARVIPNGRSAQLFRREAKQAFILAAGRLWDEGKNVQALTDIAPELGWPVFLAGDHRGMELPGCRCLGQLGAEELAGWFARAAIYVLPARYEPFGLSALEAALAGCALVLGDIPSLREVWGDAAVFVPPADRKLLQAAVRGLMGDAALREEMAARAVARARCYTQDRMVSGYLRAYEFARERANDGRLACAS